MIILLGKDTDESIQQMNKVLSHRNISFITLNTARFTKDIKFSYSPNDNQGRLKIGSQNTATHLIKSIFWTRVYPPVSEIFQHKLGLSMCLIQQEANCFLQSFLTLPNVNWCNSWQAYQLHKTKPLQLSIAKQLGANIPNTLIGNMNEATQHFVKSKKCIEKPIHGGYLTRYVDKSKLSADKSFPSTIQTFIEGTNIRTYLIGHLEFSAQINTINIDFRCDQNVTLSRITLPPNVRSLAFRIMKAFDMRWTAIDWILNEKSEYVFLEANPAPLFVEFERATGYPISESIMAMLLPTQNN